MCFLCVYAGVVPIDYYFGKSFLRLYLGYSLSYQLVTNIILKACSIESISNSSNSSGWREKNIVVFVHGTARLLTLISSYNSSYSRTNSSSSGSSCSNSSTDSNRSTITSSRKRRKRNRSCTSSYVSSRSSVCTKVIVQVVELVSRISLVVIVVVLVVVLEKFQMVVVKL